MHSASEEKQLEKLLNGVDIPPCPAILIEIDAELRKEAPDQREIARLISKDVALSGHVMLIANSPAFSTGHKLNSIIQALNILGSKQVFNLVVSQLLKIALSGKPDVPMDRFWESSALAARVSAELAKRLRCVRPDVAYTFGLFHDCGIPLLMKRFPQTREVLAEANASEELKFTEVEEKHLGTNHAVVGYFLARRWHLPADVTEAILHHHDYSVLGESGDLPKTVRAVIAVSVLADHIIRLHAQADGEQEWAKAAPQACEFFGLSLGAVDDLIEDILEWLA
jgi:HD-like signal output (HDOD) protein